MPPGHGPITYLHYERGDRIHEFYDGNDYGRFSYYDTNQEKRNLANQLINKYIRLNNIVQKKVDNFYNNNMAGKKTIGIHVRGTDKASEDKPVAPQRLVEEALRHADQNTQFFIASDEKKLFDEICRLLNGRKITYYDCYRAEHVSQPLHLPIRRPSRAQLGEDVVVEMLLLSKCDTLIHTLSNVSAVPLYFNPHLPHVLLRG